MKTLWFLLAVLVLVLVFILPACSQSSSTPAATGAPASQAAGNAIELKFSYWPPPADPWVQQGILPFGPDLEKATNNKVKVTYFGGATLGAPPDHLDLIKKGIADIGWINPSFTPGVFPLTDIRNLPFLYPSPEVAAKVFWKQQEILNPIEYKDVKVLWTFPNPLMELSTAKKPIKTLEDLKGLKFGETEPLAAKTDALLGTVPVVMQETEIYTALGNGMLDGRFQEYNGLLTWKCGEVTKYRVDNVRIATHQNIIIMNLQKYNSLPADIKKALDDQTGFNRSAESGVIWARLEKEAHTKQLADDKARGNPEPYILPDSERTRWVAAAQPVVDEWLKDMESKGVGAQAKDLLAKTKQWITEYSK
jgi:TRAP-type transport system periplasmic protein